MVSVYVSSVRLLVCSLLMVVRSTSLEQSVRDSLSKVSANWFCSEKIVSACCSKPSLYDHCTVDLASFGCDDSPRYGYVKTSGGSYDDIYIPSHFNRYRGVTLFELDPKTCTTSSRLHFDTYESQSDRVQLVKNLEWAKAGTIIIGVTADSAESSTEFQNTAGPFFASYHMNLRGLKLRDKFAFIMQKGYPAKTVFERKPRYGKSIRMRISVRGSTIQDVSFYKTYK